MTTSRKIAVLMGPTGSGKTAMALAIAASRPAVIINADAMQMVSALRVLSARPSVEEERQAEHALYGVLRAEEPTSVARWLGLVEPVIARAWGEGKLPLLVGGTGMYIKALMEGLAEVPPVAAAVREKYRAMAGDGAQGENTPPPVGGSLGLHALLQRVDPIMAARLEPGDSQRLIRALEVMEGTGESLAYWQERTAPPLFPQAEYRCYYMAMAREEVYARIDRRFEAMLESGALDEVRRLLEMRDWGLAMGGEPLAVRLRQLPPIFRAHGVPELIAHLRGEMTLAESVARGQQNTRNYAKRQMTWIRNQLADGKAVTGTAVPPDFRG